MCANERIVNHVTAKIQKLLIMLLCKNLSYTIQNKKIIDNLTLEVHEGQIVALMSSNGSGKTTLLRHLAGLQKPQSGSIYVDNLELDSTIYPKVTMVTQEANLYPHLNVKNNILLAAKKINKFNELVEFFGIKDLLNKFPRELSGGQKQIVAFVRAVIIESKYLILDEVTSALDTHNIELIESYLLMLKAQGVGIVLTTHSFNHAKRISDQIYILDSGKVAAFGGARLNL